MDIRNCHLTDNAQIRSSCRATEKETNAPQRQCVASHCFSTKSYNEEVPYQYCSMTDILKDSTNSLIRRLLPQQQILYLPESARLPVIHKMVPAASIAIQ